MNPKRMEFNKDDINRFIVSKSNSHSMTTFNRRWMPVPFLYRDFLTKHTWKRLDENRIIYCTYNDDELAYPLPQMSNKSKGVRPFFFSAILIENSVRDDSNMPEIFQNSIVSLIIDLDGGGAISQQLRQYACLRSMTVLTDIEKYFKTRSQNVENCREECMTRFAHIQTRFNTLNPSRLPLFGSNMFELDEDEEVVDAPNSWLDFTAWLTTSVPWLKNDNLPSAEIFSGTLFRPMLTGKVKWNGGPKPFDDDFTEKQFIVFSFYSFLETLQGGSKKLSASILLLGLWNLTLTLRNEGGDGGVDQHGGSYSFYHQTVLVIFIISHLVLGIAPVFLLEKSGTFFSGTNGGFDKHTVKILSSCTLLLICPVTLIVVSCGAWRPIFSTLHTNNENKTIVIPIFLMLRSLNNIFKEMPLHLWRRLSVLMCVECALLIPHYPSIYNATTDEERNAGVGQCLHQIAGVVYVMFVLSGSANTMEFHRRHLFSMYWMEYRHKFMHERDVNRNSTAGENNAAKAVLSQLNSPAVRRQLAGLLDIQIEYRELKYLNEVGKGGNGVVFAATYRNQVVAVKQLISTRLSESAIMNFIGEMQFGVMLRHKNIVSTIACVLKLPHICCVLEYAKEGTLRDVMLREMLMDWSNSKRAFSIDICQGMRYLHEREHPIIHRDLKTTNVLVTDWRSAKISDFGSSRLLPDNPDELTFDVGTALYMPPEVLKGDTYGTRSDVYSFGCILIDLAMHGMSRELYFMGSNAPNNLVELTEKVAKGWRPKLPAKWKIEMPLITNLIKSCWAHDQYKRPSFKAIEKVLSSWDGEVLTKDLNSAVAHASVYSFEEEAFIDGGYEYLLEGLAKVKQADKKRKPTIKHMMKDGLDETNTALNLSFEFTNYGGIGVQSRIIPFGAAQVANFIVQLDHPMRKLINKLEGVEKSRKTLHRENEHNTIFQIVRNFPPPMKNREFLLRQVWKRISQGIYLVFAESTDHPSCPINDLTVRATCKSAILVQDIPGTNFCKVTNRFSLGNLFGAGGYFPNIMSSLATHRDNLSLFLWVVEAFLTRERETVETFLHPPFSQGNHEKNAKSRALFDRAYEEYLKLVPEDQRKRERIEDNYMGEEDLDDSSYGSSFKSSTTGKSERNARGYFKSWKNTAQNIVDYAKAKGIMDDYSKNENRYREESEPQEREEHRAETGAESRTEAEAETRAETRAESEAESEAEAQGSSLKPYPSSDGEDSQPWAKPLSKSTRERRNRGREDSSGVPKTVKTTEECGVENDIADGLDSEIRTVNGVQGVSGDDIV